MNVISYENSKCKCPEVEKGLGHSRYHQKVSGSKCHEQG